MKYKFGKPKPKKEKHIHDWVEFDEPILLRNTRKYRGRMIRDIATGKDTLKRRKCKTCPATETYDLVRFVA